MTKPHEVCDRLVNVGHAARTAVVSLAHPGSTMPEIMGLTGHSPRDAENIPSTDHLAADRELSGSASRKMETYRAAKQTKTMTMTTGLDANA